MAKNSRCDRNDLGGSAYLVLLILLTTLLAAQLAFALQWRMEHDTPLLHYVAYLMDEFDSVPYKDIFEINPPGTLLFHYCIGRLVGYGDLQFRIVDLAWLLALLAVTWGLMRKFGFLAAWTAVVLFGLYYLQEGPGMSLQRDYVGLLPVATACLLAASDRSSGGRLRTFFIGLLFGLAATLKPHLVIGLPVVFFFMLWPNGSEKTGARGGQGWQSAIRQGFLTLLGLMLPIAAALLWLWRSGALGHFIEIYRSYLPLYLQLTGGHRILLGAKRFIYLLRSYSLFGRYFIWLIPLSLIICRIIVGDSFTTRRRRLAVLLATLTAAYSIYPTLSGQFWAYHWMPFLYFVLLTAAILLADSWDKERSRGEHLFVRIVLVFCLLMSFNPQENFIRQFTGQSPLPPKDGRVDEIADFLRGKLRPDDRVQPLDWTGGAVHAMLLAKARVATPFLYDYHFCHHISNSYIQQLRQRFISALYETRPRFIIYVSERPRVSGPDCSNEFPQLVAFVEENYISVLEGEGYVIFERAPG